jgi:hypothetical protein
MKYIIEEGEHKGHEVVKDKWAIDYFRADPETSFYCLTCHMELTVDNVEEIHAPEKVTGG